MVALSEDLYKLVELLKSGALTQAEFEGEKAKLLGKNSGDSDSLTSPGQVPVDSEDEKPTPAEDSTSELVDVVEESALSSVAPIEQNESSPPLPSIPVESVSQSEDTSEEQSPESIAGASKEQDEATGLSQEELDPNRERLTVRIRTSKYGKEPDSRIKETVGKAKHLGIPLTFDSVQRCLQEAIDSSDRSFLLPLELGKELAEQYVKILRFGSVVDQSGARPSEAAAALGTVPFEDENHNDDGSSFSSRSGLVGDLDGDTNARGDRPRVAIYRAERPTDESVDAFTSDLCHLSFSPDDPTTEETIRELFRDKLRHEVGEDFADMADAIQFTQLTSQFVYRVQLDRQVECRAVVRRFSGTRDSHRTAQIRSATKIDPWGPSVAPPALLESHQESVHHPDSVDVTTCSKCRGAARQTCGECHGRRDVTCRSCRGSRQEKCDSCYGRGEVKCWPHSGSRDVRCGKCGGYDDKNYIPCSHCSGGFKTCRTCNGRGEVTCWSCSGRGEVDCSGCSGCGNCMDWLETQITIEPDQWRGYTGPVGLADQVLLEAGRAPGSVVFRNRINISESMTAPSIGLAELSELTSRITGQLRERIPKVVRSDDRHSGARLLDASLEIIQIPVDRVDYSLNGETGVAYFLGRNQVFWSEGDPVSNLIEARDIRAVFHQGLAQLLAAATCLLVPLYIVLTYDSKIEDMCDGWGEACAPSKIIGYGFYFAVVCGVFGGLFHKLLQYLYTFSEPLTRPLWRMRMSKPKQGLLLTLLLPAIPLMLGWFVWEVIS